MARSRAVGEGTIYHNILKDRWEGQFSYIDAKTGKTKRKKVTGKTQKEVAKKGKDFIKNLENGLLPEYEKITVGEWLERWLEDYARPNIAVKSYEKYCSDIRGYIIPALGNILLKKLNSADIQRVFNELQISGRKRPRKGEKVSGLSSWTIRAARRCFTMAIEKAFQIGLIRKNVVKETKPPKHTQKEIHPLSKEQANKLLNVARQGGYMPKEYYKYYNIYQSDYAKECSYMIVLLALHTGMRRGEVLGLKWTDIDTGRGRINVNRSLVVSQSKGVIFQEPKTAGSKRGIAVPEVIIKALERYRKAQEWHKNIMGDKYEESKETKELVFTNIFGKPINGTSFVSRIYKRMLKKAGIENTFTFHDLRHTHATLLLKQGVNIKLISERLGHTTVAMTLNTYSHLMPDMQKTAVDALNKMFG